LHLCTFAVITPEECKGSSRSGHLLHCPGSSGSGSNASLLSRELGTKLTGRHITIELFPFSYSEFVRFSGLEFSEASLERYLFTGGFPEYVRQGSGLILNNLFEDILSRDIVVRYGIRDVSSLRQMAVYLISNIGKPVSGKSLTDMFGISSNSTVLEYFSHLENSWLFQFLPIFSYSIKTQLRNPRKVYTIDPGLFTENSIVFSDEKGRRLENLVYIHLRRKYIQLYYFKGKGECDFIAMEKGKVEEIIQVSYELNDMNFSREYNGLTEAMDFFSFKTGKIITFNYKDKIEKDGRIVEVIPSFEYLAK
jgi:predicted AAA+ superfamily ATPase